MIAQCQVNGGSGPRQDVVARLVCEQVGQRQGAGVGGLRRLVVVAFRLSCAEASTFWMMKITATTTAAKPAISAVRIRPIRVCTGTLSAA
jgi:hypothetical protein